MRSRGILATVSDDRMQIRNGLAAWSRGDLAGAMDGLDPDLLYVTSGLFPGVAPTYRGHEGFRRFWSDFREFWEEIAVHVEDIVEGPPGRYAVLGRFEATGRNGIPVGRPVGMVFVVRDELVMEIHSHATWSSALDSAGVGAARRPD